MLEYRYFHKINHEFKRIVEDAINDLEKQFQLSQHLIEGQFNFPFNAQLGIQYLKQSIRNGYSESLIYYCQLLINGKVIPKNHAKVKKILETKFKSQESIYSFFIGKLLKNEKKYSEAIVKFEKSMNAGNSEAMLEYAQMLYKGLGCPVDKKKLFYIIKNQ